MANSNSNSTARVQVSLGRTVNLGNFESLRLDVSFARDCDDTPEALEATYRDLLETCEKRIEEALED